MKSTQQLRRPGAASVGLLIVLLTSRAGAQSTAGQPVPEKPAEQTPAAQNLAVAPPAKDAASNRGPVLVTLGAAGADPPSSVNTKPAGKPVVGSPATEKRGPFDVHWAIDLPVTTASLLVGVVPYGFTSELRSPVCGLTCDKSKINALDRTVVGNHSQRAADYSDGLLVASVVYPVLFDLIDVTANGPRSSDEYAGFGRDTLILAEVLSINFALNTVVKFAVSRPRPLVYDPAFSDAERTKADAGLSFYSGHSSTAFAMATAYSYLFTLRHPHSALVAPMWILTEGAAVATAGLRVAAGKHFWSDVLTGGAVGLAIGTLVPFLHTRTTLPSSLVGARKLDLHVLPAEFPGGGGLVVAVQ